VSASGNNFLAPPFLEVRPIPYSGFIGPCLVFFFFCSQAWDFIEVPLNLKSPPPNVGLCWLFFQEFQTIPPFNIFSPVFSGLDRFTIMNPPLPFLLPPLPPTFLSLKHGLPKMSSFPPPPTPWMAIPFARTKSLIWVFLLSTPSLRIPFTFRGRLFCFNPGKRGLLFAFAGSLSLCELCYPSRAGWTSWNTHVHRTTTSAMSSDYFPFLTRFPIESSTSWSAYGLWSVPSPSQEAISSPPAAPSFLSFLVSFFTLPPV